MQQKETLESQIRELTLKLNEADSSKKELEQAKELLDSEKRLRGKIEEEAKRYKLEQDLLRVRIDKEVGIRTVLEEADRVAKLELFELIRELRSVFDPVHRIIQANAAYHQSRACNLRCFWRN